MQLLPIVLAVSGVWPGRLNLPMAQTCFCLVSEHGQRPAP